MLFHVRMDVRLPHDLGPAERAEIVTREKEYSQRLQRAGKWPHIWRIAGEYANFSILDVESNDELHELLSGLPLFPYMDIRVTPLATHPSDINAARTHEGLRTASWPIPDHAQSAQIPWYAETSRGRGYDL